MFINTNIQVKYDYTDNLYLANQYLNKLPDLFAVDFEAASKFTAAEKVKFAETHTAEECILASTALSPPAVVDITHLSISFQQDYGYVIICSTDAMRELIFKFLTSTSSKQIWHNTGYDFKHILFHTGELPQNYEDTLLLAKCLRNKADISGYNLKKLMEHRYGEWALSEDIEFTKDNIKNPKMLQYAATDACATYLLYQELMNEVTNDTILS